MLLTERGQETSWGAGPVLETPFAEALAEAQTPSRGFEAWRESASPFSAASVSESGQSASEAMLAQALAELRDEAFNDAVVQLAEETEQAVSERFAGETPAPATERARYGDAQLSAVQFEAEQYLNALEQGLASSDLSSLGAEQLEGAIAQFDPQPSGLTPAGEEFIGSLVRKAKKAVKFVAKAAGSVGKVAGALLSPVLGRLKALIRPLLKRVLAIAIGRLPAPLQPAARTLASKLQLEAESDAHESVSPANLTDGEALAEEFDAALAEAFAPDATEMLSLESESFDQEDETDSRALERLAQARGNLIDSLRDGDEAAVGSAVEQFVPALLGALKLGINLVGRPKVVSFLAGFVGKLIGRWVGPQLSRPLSQAIVDTGLRLVSLEAEEQALETDEAGPVALASVVEDTVRRLAEQEAYIFEDEELTQLATAEAFAAAAATHLPARFVRQDLRQSHGLDGAFVARHPRRLRRYHKYSRAPEVEITAQIADALPTFGGITLGAALRAAGVALPVRARLHLYQSAVGTTLPAIARTDRAIARGARGFVQTEALHPLTPAAAGLLLREPALGVTTPAKFLRSRHRIATGQRFYAIQPLGAQAGQPARGDRAAHARSLPGRAHIQVDARRGEITVRLGFSEADAQQIAQAVRGGHGHGALLKAVIDTYRSLDPAGAPAPVLREDGEVFEELSPVPHKHGRRHGLRRHLRAWLIPAFANWARSNADAFARAAANPAAGVTVVARLSGLTDFLAAKGGQQAANGRRVATPSIAITVAPGIEAS